MARLKASTRKILRTQKEMRRFQTPRERKAAVPLARVRLEVSRVKRIRRKLKVAKSR